MHRYCQLLEWNPNGYQLISKGLLLQEGVVCFLFQGLLNSVSGKKPSLELFWKIFEIRSFVFQEVLMISFILAIGLGQAVAGADCPGGVCSASSSSSVGSSLILPALVPARLSEFDPQPPGDGGDTTLLQTGEDNSS